MTLPPQDQYWTPYLFRFDTGAIASWRGAGHPAYLYAGPERFAYADCPDEGSAAAFLSWLDQPVATGVIGTPGPGGVWWTS